MLNRTWCPCVVTIWCLLTHSVLHAQSQLIDSKVPVSDAEIVALIPRSTDGPPNSEELDRVRRLVDLGAKAYPALCAKLLETDDVYLASRILSILAESQGDKTLPRQTISKLLRKWTSKTENGRTFLNISALALGKIGTKADIPVLLSLLSDSAPSVRINTLRSLATLGDEQTAEQVREWIAERRKVTESRTKGKDPSIPEAEKTLSALEERSKKH